MVIVGGMVAGVSVKYTRNNDKMAFITLEDFQGSMEIVVFPKVYEKCAPLFAGGCGTAYSRQGECFRRWRGQGNCSGYQKSGAERSGQRLRPLYG